MVNRGESAKDGARGISRRASGPVGGEGALKLDFAIAEKGFT
jgi:hypothetical protein